MSSLGVTWTTFPKSLYGSYRKLVPFGHFRRRDGDGAEVHGTGEDQAVCCSTLCWGTEGSRAGAWQGGPAEDPLALWGKVPPLCPQPPPRPLKRLGRTSRKPERPVGWRGRASPGPRREPSPGGTNVSGAPFLRGGEKVGRCTVGGKHSGRVRI